MHLLCDGLVRGAPTMVRLSRSVSKNRGFLIKESDGSKNTGMGARFAAYPYTKKTLPFEHYQESYKNANHGFA